MMLTRALGSAAALSFVALAAGCAQGPSSLGTAIDAIAAIDNHAHVVAPDPEHDHDYDALPCDALPPSPVLAPANLRFGPDTTAAWSALWGFGGTSADDAQIKAIRQAQDRVREREGTRYFAWVLDRANIETVLANRIAMVPPLAAPRVRWVPYDDALLFPLDNSNEKARTSDRQLFYQHEEHLLREYVRAVGLTALPATLDGYLKLVKDTLGRQKSGGAVAIKFEAAYLRALDFGLAEPAAARAVYERRTSTVPAADYKVLQDFLFHEVAAEAGRLGMAVHIHTGNGCGDFFDPAGAQPLLLSTVLNDASLRSTSFVLLHGASPVERTVSSLMLKPNVYVDMSVLELMWSPSELARILRPWLEMMPEHILFGTDAGPFGPGLGWEETTWLGSRNARRALTIALTQMIDDGVVTPARAREIATRVLHDNAAELYKFPKSAR